MCLEIIQVRDIGGSDHGIGSGGGEKWSDSSYTQRVDLIGFAGGLVMRYERETST